MDPFDNPSHIMFELEAAPWCLKANGDWLTTYESEGGRPKQDMWRKALLCCANTHNILTKNQLKMRC